MTWRKSPYSEQMIWMRPGQGQETTLRQEGPRRRSEKVLKTGGLRRLRASAWWQENKSIGDRETRVDLRPLP